MSDHDDLTIGELAEAAGVTPRAIRHYEAEGLLAPAGRTAAGYRLFDRSAALRLYRIVALRRLGLGVEEVRDLLDAPDEAAALREAAGRHLAHLDRRLAEVAALRASVAALATDPDPDPTTALEATAMTVRIDRVTTATGDDGSTRTGRARVRKDDARVEALGSLDELNARLATATAHDDLDAAARELLVEVQHRLFDVGADLVRVGDGRAPHLDGSHAARLTAEVEARAGAQPRLDSFLIPGGGPTAAALHTCRTAARTAERRAVALDDPALAAVVAYLNRLSDLLFVLAREATGPDAETCWEPLPTPGSPTGA